MGIKPFDELDAELVDLNRDGKLDLVQLSETKLMVSLQKTRPLQEGLRAQPDRRRGHRRR